MSEGARTFTERFAEYSEGYHLMPGLVEDCSDCGEDDTDEFSCQQCEGCGSRLAGSRHVCHSFVEEGNPRKGLMHWSVCCDCLMYIANGDIPEGEE